MRVFMEYLNFMWHSAGFKWTARLKDYQNCVMHKINLHITTLNTDVEKKKKAHVFSYTQVQSR